MKIDSLNLWNMKSIFGMAWYSALQVEKMVKMDAFLLSMVLAHPMKDHLANILAISPESRWVTDQLYLRFVNYSNQQ